MADTLAELTAYYRKWLKDDAETADWRARYALGNMLNLAHEVRRMRGKGIFSVSTACGELRMA